MPWDRAIHALSLLAIDPKGLGGMLVRARSGPVRDTFLRGATVLDGPIARLHPSMDDEALFGGLDLTETLTTGHMVQRKGLLETSNAAVLTMAERSDATLAAKLAVALDTGELTCLIALDEGAEPDERCPKSLEERLAFRIELECSRAEIGQHCDRGSIVDARDRLARVSAPDTLYETLTQLCVSLGISSLRAPLFAMAAARANAALEDRDEVTSEDIEAAAALCLAHRATRLPQQEQDQPEDEAPPPPETEGDADQGDHSQTEIPPLSDMLLEAVLATLPDGLLDHIANPAKGGRGSGAGARHKGNRRGRPKPSRPGRLSGQNRLDLVATLRAAVPWQRLRGGELGKVRVMPSDFRIKQYEDLSDRLLIFAVDASGSAAIARLAEAKGAVELLLSDAYSRRDHVCLVAFRGEGAETLLSPTRSLVQTKRRLAALPGGGGTPLAAGLLEARTLADHAHHTGMTPCVILLTDGRANIALDGTADRARAGSDAMAAARALRSEGIDAIVLDLGNRPSKALEELSAELGGTYLPLPRADAKRMSGAVSSVIGP